MRRSGKMSCIQTNIKAYHSMNFPFQVFITSNFKLHKYNVVLQRLDAQKTFYRNNK